ncbi:DUF1905 domain-containing protein [Hymenobacter canadensis]|uniref:DUF1905 domain-containing protein n=1 Tax=Hymenobacter canadensis TaxID=2999067 RepID=A0ABY7LNC4_9BACT|nr:DUF1905 domain-containing protein [Hymenobacter canadensis]WBA40690.1 DUF1905 domain-containing protein [Hymenobacter canadensis]
MLIELFNGDVTLERFPGKGGWTYAPLPATVTAPRSWFNQLRVSGQIDDFALENASLMSLGKGRLFLPVRAEIRKQIGKQAGDVVRLVLLQSEGDAPLAVSAEDFRECLAEVPGALARYEQLPAADQQAWVAWVAAAPTDEQKVARVETACQRLAAHAGPEPCLPPA